MKNPRINMQIDMRAVSAILLSIIVVITALWAPWNASEHNDEIIKVTGETVLKAEPDEFIFNPTYQFRHADKTSASNQATEKGQLVSAKLRELGVPANSIKLSVDGYMGGSFPDSEAEEYTYTTQLTITIDDRDKAQKIQDYLITTEAQGSITPRGSFSQTKRIELESKAREYATKDARAKADQSAKNLGFKLGRVKSVEDVSGFNNDGPIALEARGMTEDVAISSLPLQPGENEIRYSVAVTYYVR